MKNIDQFLKELIPPNNRTHREGFTNYDKIDSLSDVEMIKVEQELIKMLRGSEDWLIGETLSYMKSESAIPIMKEKLEKVKGSCPKILWANAIFKINKDIEMTNIAFEEFQKIEDKFELIPMFHFLTQFEDSRIIKRIENYQNHDDYLIASNALIALGKDTSELIKRRKQEDEVTSNGKINMKKKPWWKFW